MSYLNIRVARGILGDLPNLSACRLRKCEQETGKNIGHARWKDLLRALKSQDAKRFPSIEVMITAGLVSYLRYKFRKAGNPESVV